MAVTVITGGAPAADLSGATPVAQPASDATAATAAANTQVQVVYAAVPNQRHRLTMLDFSYSAAPTAGRVTVQDGATTVIDLDVTVGGDQVIPLPPGGVRGSVNTAMTITLAAGGAAVVGKLVTAKLTG